MFQVENSEPVWANALLFLQLLIALINRSAVNVWAIFRDFLFVVDVDLPLLRVAVVWSDNPRI